MPGFPCGTCLCSLSRYGQLSGMVEPLAGLFGAFAVVLAEPILPYALAFAAGAMVYVVVDDIIPEAQIRWESFPTRPVPDPAPAWTPGSVFALSSFALFFISAPFPRSPAPPLHLCSLKPKESGVTDRRAETPTRWH